MALQLADSSGLVGIAVSHHTVSGMTRAANRPRTHQFEHNGVNGLYKGLTRRSAHFSLCLPLRL